MAFLLGLAACVGLWWFTRNGWPIGWRLSPTRLRRLAGWALLGLALFLLLRGQALVAGVFGLGGVWLLEGAQRMGGRFRRLIGPGRHAGDPARRTASLEMLLGADGRPLDGTALAGPLAGRRFSDLPVEALREFRDLIRPHDAVGLALLEAYLDGRVPGWRENAQADRDPGPGRPLHPGAMTEEEAHEILGLQRGATPEEIRAAHRALMKRLHPDQGGSVERAARVNAARDRLLDRHR